MCPRAAGSATISDHPLDPRSALGEVDCGAELNPIRRKLCEVKRRRVDLKTVLINRKHSDHAAAAVHEGQGRYRPVPEEVDCGAEANPIRRKLCEVKTQRARVRPTPDSEVASRVDGPAVEPTPASFEEPR